MLNYIQKECLDMRHSFYDESNLMTVKFGLHCHRLIPGILPNTASKAVIQAGRLRDGNVSCEQVLLKRLIHKSKYSQCNYHIRQHIGDVIKE